MSPTSNDRQTPESRPVRKGVPSTDATERHPTPSSPEEGHMGATEDQVSKTPHPTPDDDEPKQG
jgi:hypothetical protein